jgi:hypothetical protein
MLDKVEVKMLKKLSGSVEIRKFEFINLETYTEMSRFMNDVYNNLM